MSLAIQRELLRTDGYGGYTPNEKGDTYFPDILIQSVAAAREAAACDAPDFKEATVGAYRIVPEKEIGGLRIYVNGESAGVFQSENLKIQEDAATGVRVLVNELPGFGDSFYSALPVDGALEAALAEAMGTDGVPHQPLEGYYIGTHAGTGIHYLMRPGDEGRGGCILLCNETDRARYEALGREYAAKYPNLINSQAEGLIYANFEIRGMAHRAKSGIVMTHPDRISYNDNEDGAKSWSMRLSDSEWQLLLGWFKSRSLPADKIAEREFWESAMDRLKEGAIARE